jgi:hypothetical protein
MVDNSPTEEIAKMEISGSHQAGPQKAERQSQLAELIERHKQCNTHLASLCGRFDRLADQVVGAPPPQPGKERNAINGVPSSALHALRAGMDDNEQLLARLTGIAGRLEEL